MRDIGNTPAIPLGVIGCLFGIYDTIYILIPSSPNNNRTVHSFKSRGLVFFLSKSDVLYHRENVMFCNTIKSGISVVSAFYHLS